MILDKSAHSQHSPSGIEAVRVRFPGGSELARSEEYDLERAEQVKD